MKVRQLVGSRAGEVVDMPYHVSVRALASGSAESLDMPPARLPRDSAPASPIAQSPKKRTTRASASQERSLVERE